MVKAYDAVDRVAADLDATFAALKATWEKSMFPIPGHPRLRLPPRVLAGVPA